MFSIEAEFDASYIDDFIDTKIDEWFDEMVDSLRKAGQKLVNKARAKTRAEGGFNNITWNLRASIGMCLVDETGEIVETYFPKIAKGVHGDQLGRETAEQISKDVKRINQMCMVFVAAEHYAVFVQAKGRDVIKHVIGNNMEREIKALLGE